MNSPDVREDAGERSGNARHVERVDERACVPRLAATASTHEAVEKLFGLLVDRGTGLQRRAKTKPFLVYGADLTVLTPESYETEDVLQQLLATHPAVLAGPPNGWRPGRLVRRDT